MPAVHRLPGLVAGWFTIVRRWVEGSETSRRQSGHSRAPGGSVSVQYRHCCTPLSVAGVVAEGRWSLIGSTIEEERTAVGSGGKMLHSCGFDFSLASFNSEFALMTVSPFDVRSEERRVGKDGRRWWVIADGGDTTADGGAR